MAADAAAARDLVVMSEAAEELLLSPARPIVLAPRRANARVAPSVAPGAPELGVMLPYSPLHHLLMSEVGEPLVMTSGNVSDEPIAYQDGDACERLADIADLFLLHDRAIETRTDDSVVRVAGERPTFLRRSRGFVPARCRCRWTAAGTCSPAGRAEEHVRAGEGRPRVGGSSHRRPEELRDAHARSRPGSSTSGVCSRSSPRWWCTTCTRSTSRRSTRWSWTACG
jgi:hypothetical protein